MKEIIQIFLKIGCFGFGGPIALIGMMEKEWVQRRNWMKLEDFQRTLAVSKLFPGPLSSMLGIRIAMARAGILGGMVSGICLILPSFLMILALAFFLNHLQESASVHEFLYGLQIGALAITALSVVSLAKPQLKNKMLWAPIALVALITALYPKLEPLTVISCGIIPLASLWMKRNRSTMTDLATLAIVFWICLRSSLTTFGSGIAIVPSLHTGFVENLGWLSESQFLSALFLGQITPGPLLIVSTDVGLQIAGYYGAILATVGAFLPAFFFGIFIIPLVEKTLLRSAYAKTFLSGVLVGVAGALIGSLIKLGHFAWFNGKHPLSGLTLCVCVLAVPRIRNSNPVLLIFGLGLAYFGISRLLLS